MNGRNHNNSTLHMTPHSHTFIPPPGYTRIKAVRSFVELITTPMSNGINALCWQRTLPGDFCEIVGCLGVIREITTLDHTSLLALPLSPAGQTARDILIQDQYLLREAGLAPSLDCIPTYPRDADAGPVPTDVYSFHADSATVVADTYLCSYTEAASEGLRNDEARRRVDIPETRAALLKLYGGADDDLFAAYLNDHCYDLHYAPIADARPFNFGLGNLWRIATEYPDSLVPPCIHRAPTTLPGRPPRLLLIS